MYFMGTNQDFVDYLNGLMVNAGMSQSDLARKINRPRATINGILMRKRGVGVRKGEIIIRVGKGGKGREVPFSQSTGQAVVKYLSTRPDRQNPDAPLLIALTGSRLDRRRLTNQLATLGKRVGVSDVHPHRFRHTFAITFLRNGGDVFSLQKLMGHESLTTTLRYLALAQVDIEAAHRKASPVDTWRL